MTPKQYRSLARYIATLAAEMGLRDWTLNFHTEPPDDENAMAAVSTVYGRKLANVYVCEDFAKYDPEGQRVAIVHELIHVHFAQEWQAVEDGFRGLGIEARRLADAAYRNGHEYGVDGLAAAIAPHYALWEG